MSKVIKKEDFLKLSLVELNEKLLLHKKILFDLRFFRFLNKTKDTSLLKKNRKIIAKIKTRINCIKID